MSNGLLRLVSFNSVAVPQEHSFALDNTAEVFIGRDPNCQIVLDGNFYGMVSRRHAVIRPSRSPDGKMSFVVCDLNSANGTYLNGKRLQGCQELQGSDRVTLGSDGPEFIFQSQLAPQTPPVTPISTTSAIPSSETSIFDLLPIFSPEIIQNLTRKAYLIPGIVTVIFVVLMFVTVGEPKLNQLLVATYIGVGAYYFIYRLCGKHKPWWLPVVASLACMLLLITPVFHVFVFVFRQVLPGGVPDARTSVPLPILFINFFFGAGLLEELLKALPVIIAYFIGRRLSSPARERIGVWEPLDGILLGSASALGFTLLETLGQYVPQITANVATEYGGGAGALVGLQLLIPRILGSVAGHMAWSGWFGYCIGLSVLKPTRRWRTLAVGYISAAAIHALWNTTASVSPLLLVVVGVLSYAFLTAAILKARTLSPTRKQNFATRFL